MLINKHTNYDVLLFSHDVDRALSLEGKAFSPLIDSSIKILREDNISCKSILLPWSKLKRKETFNEAANLSWFYLIPAILDKLLNTIVARSGKIDFNRVLFYRLIIKFYKPKLIISIGAPTYLFKAANLTNTKTAELLHGMGYATIPWNWEALSQQEVPNIVLALDNISKETFAKSLGKNFITYHISHPFFASFLCGAEISQVEWSLNLPTSCKFEKTVLLTLNWGYGGDHGPYLEFQGVYTNGLFDEILLEVIRETKEQILWRIRLHPVHLRKKGYDWVRKYITEICETHSNCEWEETSRAPLPVVALKSDCHVTMISMSSYDCAYFGLNTLALCPTLQQGGKNEMMFNDLVENEFLVKGGPNKTQIMEWLKSTTRRKPYSARTTIDISTAIKELM
jgi:hypothetical protein